ncbi:hypothetical protein SAMN05216517_110169 [Janthinobacterium sp. OK676]|nr:hypothetical protein SAMN05216517_110169 [Janthinobacterium sp. OK676]
MHIPLAIFKDTGSVYGVNVPDIQGVHSWEIAWKTRSATS